MTRAIIIRLRRVVSRTCACSTSVGVVVAASREIVAVRSVADSLHMTINVSSVRAGVAVLITYFCVNAATIASTDNNRRECA